jgi:glucose/mannose-6-phosphate isomerase
MHDREVLDDKNAIPGLDRAGILGFMDRFDEQIEESLSLCDGMAFDYPAATIDNVVISGLGGSAIGGDFVRSYLGSSLRVPLTVNRSYDMPGFAGPRTLAIFCSYSGNTEETLSAFEGTAGRGVQGVCITSGGELEKRARARRFPCIRIPAGQPPRTAIGYSAIPILLVLGAVGLIEDRKDEIAASIPFIRRKLVECSADRPLDSNPAKQLAVALAGRIVVAYGSQDRLDTVARRWAGQISENGKQLAYFNAFPEMNHNEIVGWKFPEGKLTDMVTVFLRDKDDHPRVQKRLALVQRDLAQRAGGSLEIWSKGSGWLERLWGLVLLGDYVSVYLAFLNGVDPTPVEPIEGLKRELQKLGDGLGRSSR